MKTLTVNEKFNDLKRTLNLVKVSANVNPPKRVEENSPLPNLVSGSDLLKYAGLAQDEEITNPLEYLELMIYNKSRMETYCDISKAQAKVSFAFALIASLVGIGFFLLASLMVILGNAAISSVIIPAVGGAITEIIAGTIFVIYKKSLEQMNYYFDSLERNDKFLSTVSLINNVSEEKQDDMYCEIIKSRLIVQVPAPGIQQ